MFHVQTKTTTTNHNNNNNNNLTACSEGGQFGERLFAGALHTNEQSMGAINAEDSVHPGQMFHSIIKEYKVHSWLALIIFLQNFLHIKRNVWMFGLLTLSQLVTYGT